MDVPLFGSTASFFLPLAVTPTIPRPALNKTRLRVTPFYVLDTRPLRALYTYLVIENFNARAD